MLHYDTSLMVKTLIGSLEEKCKMENSTKDNQFFFQQKRS